MALQKPQQIIQEQQAAQEYEYLRAVSLALRSNQFGQWSSDHTQEAKAFTGWNYLAIMAIGRQAARAVGSVYATGNKQVTTLRKSLIHKYGFSLWKSYADQGAADTVDSEENWIAALVNKPNPTQSASLFQWEFAQQLHLHGGCIIFNRPNRDGDRIAQRYIIPMALTQPVESGFYQKAPNGGIRIMPYAAGLGYFVHPMIRALTGCVIPAEWLSFPRYPHPVSRGDGKSPSDAAGPWIDTANMIDIARWRQLKRGPRPHGIVTVKGEEVTNEQLDDIEARLNRKLGEDEYDQRVLAVSEDVAVNDNTTPADMDYVNSFEQMGSATMAIHGIGKAAVGLTDNMTYGSLSAAIQQSASMVQSDMDILGGDYNQLAEDHGEKVETIYEVPAYDNPELIETQLQTDLQAGTRLGREWRAMRNLPPYGDWRDDARVTLQGFVLDTAPPSSKPQIPATFGSEPVDQPAAEPTDTAPSMPKSLAKAYRKPGFVLDRTPIIAVDLDGTLAEEFEGVFDPYVIGPPNLNVVAQVQEMAAAGCRIVVFTCRDNDDIVGQWLDQFGVPWDAINANPEGFEGSGKVFAHAYWDNRGFNVKDGADAVMQSLPDCEAKRKYFDKYPGALAEAIVTAPAEPIEDAEPAHKFGCVMLELPASVCEAIRAEQDLIDPMDLTDDGYCEKPHITLLYGITGMTLAEVVSEVRRLDELEVSFGYASAFENPDASVLKVEVESAALHEAHQTLKDCLPNVQTWPDYQPHATIAYLLPGCEECADLPRECGLTGKAARISHAIVSVDGQEARVPLRRSSSDLKIAAPSNVKFDGPAIRREAMTLAKSAAIMSMKHPVPAGVIASGVAIVAKDTGRFLMQQRAYDETKEDPAAGMWEFPGGHIERSESALAAAIREWQEETGQKLPEGCEPIAYWHSGKYIGYVIPVESEDQIAINGHRRVANPDDPDGDLVEVAAWWADADVLESDVVREELRSDCDKVRMALSKVQAMAKAMAIVSPSDMQLPTKGEVRAKAVMDIPGGETLDEYSLAKFDPNQPRDDNGRFVDTGSVESAAGDIGKAAELFKNVNDPEQRNKLEAFLREKGMSEADAKEARNDADKANSQPSPQPNSGKVTKQERNAMVDYSTDKFQEINGALRGEKPMTGDVKNIVAKMDSYIEKSPTRPGATVRSFTIPEGREDEFKKMFTEGGVLSDAAYTSTRKTPTTLDRVAFSQKITENRGVVMKVSGASGVDISSLSTNPGEGEVLYPRGTKFRVDKVIHTPNGGILAEVTEIPSHKSKALFRSGADRPFVDDLGPEFSLAKSMPEIATHDLLDTLSNRALEECGMTLEEYLAWIREHGTAPPPKAKAMDDEAESVLEESLESPAMEAAEEQAEEATEPPIDYGARLDALLERRDPDGIEDPALMDAAVDKAIENAPDALEEMRGVFEQSASRPEVEQEEADDSEEDSEVETAEPLEGDEPDDGTDLEPDNDSEATESPVEATEPAEQPENQSTAQTLPVSSVPIIEATQDARESADDWLAAYELQPVSIGQLSQAVGAIEAGDPVVVRTVNNLIVIEGLAAVQSELAKGSTELLVQLVDLNKPENQQMVDMQKVL